MKPLRALWRCGMAGVSQTRSRPPRTDQARAGWVCFITLFIWLLTPAGAASQTSADRWLVLEDGARRATVRQGADLDITHAFDLPAPAILPPQFSPATQSLYFATRDGAVAAYDLKQNHGVVRLELGAPATAMKLSSDGQWLAVATASPPTLHLFDAALKHRARHPSAALDGKAASRITSIEDAPLRRSFIVGQATLPELWEVSYDPQAKPIFDGLVHDFRMSESIAKPGFLGVRRTPLDEPLDLIAYDAPHHHVIGAPRTRGIGPAPSTGSLQVIHLDIRRRIVQIPLPESPASPAKPLTLLAVPGPAPVGHLTLFVDPQSWRVGHSVHAATWDGQVPQHPQSPHWWLVAQDGGALELFDKTSLAPHATLPMPGRPRALAFNADGRHAALVTTGAPGALLVYDTHALTQLQAISANDPVSVHSLPAAQMPATSPD